MKLSDEISKEIYETVKDSNNTLSNVEIAKKYDVTEGAIRYYVKKWESAVHEISLNNQKINTALAKNTINVQAEAIRIIQDVRESLEEAKQRGVSPEKLAPLYGNWIKSLELASEILGDINRSPQLNVQFNQEFAELKSVVISQLCPACKDAIKMKLKGL